MSGDKTAPERSSEIDEGIEKGPYQPDGEVVSNHEQVVSYSGKFNWIALMVWIFSLLVSLIPLVVYAGQYVKENGELDLAFCYQALFDNDIMWVFSTVLLFCLMNEILLVFSRKEKNLPVKAFVRPLIIVGFFIFVLTEAIWLIIKLLSFDNKPTWALVAGGIMVVISMVIATPLQINFIKEGE